MSAGLVFLSWARGGIGAGGGPVDPLQGALPARSTSTLGITVNARAERTVSARLYGPGDITGIDPRQVIRTEPSDGAVDFEPNMLAAIELDRPELPWLLTPARADAQGRLRPWMALVVVEAEHATLESRPGRPLPTLTCRLEELPDLAESWAWAHAQVAVEGQPAEADLRTLLEASPDRNLARLLSPRRLREQRRYIACLVPTFEAGRKAGLGIPLDTADEKDLSPAWAPGSGTIELPVYFSWRFATGVAGDFEELVRRLVAREMPETLGLRDMDITHAGEGLPRLPRDHGAGVLGLEGALRGPATIPTPWQPAARRSFEAALEPRLSRPADRIAPPVYGLQQARRGALPEPGGEPRWLRDLNLDPRHRAAAAFGTRVVQEHQEALMASAWDQVARIREINELLRQGQLARTAADAVYRRRLTTGEGAADERLLQLTSAAHAGIPLGGASLATQVARNSELQAAVSPAFRRLTRPRGPVARRLAATPTDRLDPLVAPLAERSLTVNPPLQPPGGMVTMRRFSNNAVGDLRPERITPRWWEGGISGPAEQAPPAEPVIEQIGAAMSNRVFAVASGRLYSCVTQQGRSWWVDHGPPPGTAATGRPAAIRDLHVLVRGADGTLRELYWDGDRWAWRSGGTPPGAYVASSPSAVYRGFRLIPGGLGQNADVRSAYVAGTNGRLYEYSVQSGAWTANWASPDGAGFSGIPGAIPDSYTILATTGARLWQLVFDGDKWNWTDLGAPGPGMRSDLGAPVQVSGVRFVMTGAGAYMRVVLGWTALSLPEPPASMIGVEGNGVWFTSQSSSRLIRVTPSTPNQPYAMSDGPPGVANTSGGVLRGAVPLVVGAGKLFERAGAGWADYGIPKAGGEGSPGALPPAHRRWRPPIGLLSSVVVGSVDAGANVIPRVGSDLGLDGQVQAGWQVRPAMPGAIGAETRGVGVAIGDINRNGRQDLLVFWVEYVAGVGNLGSYRVGWDLDAAGNPASWSPVKRLPTTMNTQYGSSGALTSRDPVTGVDVALGDLDGDGLLDMVVAYANARVIRSFYRVGFGLDANGDVTRGWTESLDVPAPAGPVRDVGVAVADLDGDFRPEIVVLHADTSGTAMRLVYHVGWNINARGFVVGRGAVRWASFVVGGDPLPTSVQGAGLVAADFTGSQKTDLAIVLVEDLAGDNRAYYRIGIDFGAGGVPESWTPSRRVDPSGTFGDETRGAGIAVGDFDPVLSGRRTALGAAFRGASVPHQALITKARVLAGADDAARLDASALAAAVPAGLDPEVTVTNRVVDRVEGVSSDELKQLADPLNPLVAAPVFPQPMYRPLADLSQDLLLPGVADVPPETATLLRANSAFIEAYMVGLNHELARELLWREFPGDRSATFFRQFWDVRGAVAAAGPLTDIPPISAWSPTAPLGRNATAIGGPGMLLLLIRGEVLRRYPTASIYARRAAYASPGGPRVLGTETVRPQFAGRLDPDLVFFGFPLTSGQALGGGTDAGYFFVIEQQPTAPRFGVDARPQGAPFGGAPIVWRDLHEGHLADSEEDDRTREQLRVAPPFDPATLPLYAADPTRPPPASFTWARNAAHMAQILFQPPVQLAIHATDMLPDVADEWRVERVAIDPDLKPPANLAAVGGTLPGGQTWRQRSAVAMSAIERGERYFVSRAAGERLEVVVAETSAGERYLRCAGTGPDPLRALPTLPEVIDG